MIYLDTSALIKLYIREAGSEWVQTLIMEQDEPLPVWDLQEMELVNALRLKVFWGDISDKDVSHQIALFQDRKRRRQYVVPLLDRGNMLKSFHKLSTQTSTIGCRTLDILHVVFALEIGAGSFVTFDERQKRLAGYAGLQVVT